MSERDVWEPQNREILAREFNDRDVKIIDRLYSVDVLNTLMNAARAEGSRSPLPTGKVGEEEYGVQTNGERQCADPQEVQHRSDLEIELWAALSEAADYIGDESAGSMAFWRLYRAAIAKTEGRPS